MTISSSQGSPLLCEGHPTRIHSPSYSPASFHHFWISKTASQKVPLGSCRNRCKIINVLGDCFQLTPRFFRWQTRLSSRFLLPVCIMSFHYEINKYHKRPGLDQHSKPDEGLCHMLSIPQRCRCKRERVTMRTTQAPLGSQSPRTVAKDAVSMCCH